MAFLCLAALAGAGETYYVDCENGDDAYAGTDIGSAAHPYASI